MYIQYNGGNAVLLAPRPLTTKPMREAPMAVEQFTKACNKCSNTFPISEFYLTKRGYRIPYCKPCSRAHVKKWREKNPEKVKISNKNWLRSHLKAKYGISVDQLNELLAKSNLMCAACGDKKHGLGASGLHIDHDHTTGEIRGLLCGPCNRGIGLLKDSADVLRGAARYLENFYEAIKV